MAYMNPGVAAAQGIEQYVLAQEARKRQDAIDAQTALHNKQIADAADFELEQKKNQAARDTFARKTANLMPGDMPDANTIAEGERLGVPLAIAKKPIAQVLAGQSTVDLPSGEGANMDVPAGSDVVPSNVVDLPGAQPAETISMNMYAGDKSYRTQQAATQLKQSQMKQVSDALKGGADPSQVMQAAITNGMDPKDAKEIIDAVHPKTQKVYRVSANRKGIEELQPTGGWAPQQGEVDKDAHWLQEPNPTTISMGMTPGANDPDALSWKVDNYIQTGQYPAMGSGNSAAMRRDAFDKATATRLKELGMTGADIARNAAQYKADTGSEGAIQKNVDAVNSFMNTADANGKILDSVLDKIPDAGYAVVNQIWRPLAGNATAEGQQAMSTFNTIRQSLQNEYARIISQPNLAGQLTDSARKEMETILNPNSTVPAIKSALTALRAEGKNRSSSYQGTLDDINSRIAGGPAAAGPGSKKLTAQELIEKYGGKTP